MNWDIVYSLIIFVMQWIVAPIALFLVVAGAVGGGLRKSNILGMLVLTWIVVYLLLKFAISPPLPGSIIGMFMGIVTLALAAYLYTNTDSINNARAAVRQCLTNKSYTPWLALVFIALPAMGAYNIYQASSAQPQPPGSGRTIHPVPPTEISFKGKKIDMVNAENPYRELKESNPQEFDLHVTNGRKIYFQNCAVCHGDNMAGDGIYAHAFDPIPANFQDATTIAMLQESYLFWRIAKGAPGLPDESTPWSSAMPAWEKFLSEEDIWDVILFLYEFTDSKPREKEEIH